MGRLIVGIIAGFLVTGVIASTGDAVVRALVPAAFPDRASPGAGWLVLALGYSTAAAVAGGYLARRVAGQRARAAVVTLAVLVVAAGIAAFTARSVTSPDWYKASSLLLAPAGVLAGGFRRAADANP